MGTPESGAFAMRQGLELFNVGGLSAEFGCSKICACTINELMFGVAPHLLQRLRAASTRSVVVSRLALNQFLELEVERRETMLHPTFLGARRHVAAGERGLVVRKRLGIVVRLDHHAADAC